MKLLLIIVLFTLLSVPIAYSKQSDASIDYITNIVYQDCQNKDLNIKDGFIFNTQTNKTVTLIPWFYSNTTVRRIIELLSETEPFDLNLGGAAISVGKDGTGILKCGSHSLDINQFTYLWDGVKLDLPKEEIMQTYGNNSPIVKNNGNNNQIAAGQNNQITNSSSSWSITILNIPIDVASFSLGGLSVGSVVSVYFLIRQRKNKQS